MINAVHKFCKTRKRLVNRRKINLVRPYSSLSSETYVFGIDYGNLLTKVSVYNYKIGKPQIIRNKIDQCDYIHSVVALDPNTNQLVTGKRAKEIKRKLPKHSVSFNKTALGSNLRDLKYTEWINNNSFSRIREKSIGHGQSTLTFPLGENYNVEYTPVDIAAETFKTAKQMMKDFLEENQSNTEEVNAYITIPYSYTQIQREAIIEAASRAGINVVKLIEEPIAALHNTRRVENYGYYSFIDAGSSLRHTLVRVYDGKYDILEKSSLDVPDMIKATENAFLEYLKKKSTGLISTTPKKVQMDELYKLFDVSKDHLMEYHDYFLPKDHIYSSNLPYISREARQLSTFLAIRNYPLEPKLKSAIEASIPLESVTHPVVIGGNSLSYPEIAAKFELFWETRLSDTVTNPTHGLSVGAAIKAAVDLGQTVSILNGEIDQYGYNYSTNPTKDSIQHHLHTKHNGYSLPFLTALTFSNIASFTPVDPLLPAFNEKQLEIEEVLKPHPAVSFTVQPDPLTGDPEYWARISIQVPKPPPLQATDEDRNIRRKYPYYRLYSISDPLPSWLIREMIAEQEPDISDVQPDLNLCFVLNLNCEPLHDTSKDVPLDAQTLDDIYNQNEEHGEMFKEHSIKHQNKLPDYAKAKASENLTNLLKMVQNKKNTKSGHYRILNRAHDIIQFIISNLNDDDRVSLISLGSKGAETKVGLLPLDYMDKSKFLDAVVNCDTIGRASERFSDAISSAHEYLISEIEKEVDVFSIMKEHEQRMKEELSMINSDQIFKQTGKMPLDIPSQDPSLWHYPLISKEVYSIWWSLLQKERYESKVKGTYVEPYTVEKGGDDESIPAEVKKDVPIEPPEPIPQRSNILADVMLAPQYKFMEGILSRMESRKLKKQMLGKQYRIVMITDGQPDPDKLKEIENAIQKASKDNISLTVLSIDGPQFEGEFLRILSRSKGARTLRLYKQYLWTTEFRNEWNDTNKIYQYLNDPIIKNLTCKVEFENYTVEKVYGGYMTNEEKARLEKLKASSTLRFKIGSLYPSYDIIPEPTEPVPDENAFLVKLKPKENIDRQSIPHWDYDPNKEPESDSNLPDVELNEMPSVNSKVTWDIQWIDYLDEKKNIQKILRLTDFNPTMNYADEPGIVKLVRIANFVESMRKILHYNFQINITNGNIPSYPLLTKETGLVRLTQTEENELLNKYLQEFREISHVAKKLIREKLPLIHPEYRDFFSYITKKYIIDSFSDGYFDFNNDIIFNLLKKYSELSGLKAPNITRNIIEGYLFRNKYYNPSLQEKIKTEPLPLWYDQFKEKNSSDPYLDKSTAIITANELDNLNIYPPRYMFNVDPDLVHYHQVGFFNITKISPSDLDSDSIPYRSNGKELLKESYGEDWKIIEKFYDDLYRFYDIDPIQTNMKNLADSFEEYIELNLISEEMEKKIGEAGVIDMLEKYFETYKFPKMKPKKISKVKKMLSQMKKFEKKEKKPNKEEIISIIDELHRFSETKDKKSVRNPIEQSFYESFLEKYKDEDVESLERYERYKLELEKYEMKEKGEYKPDEFYKFDGKFIEIDWDRKLNKLKEDAKSITRSTFFHVLEKDREFRRELRKELTDLAQRSVDTQIYGELLKRKRYADRLRRTHTNDVEVMLDIEDEIYHQKLKMDPSIYALSVWMTYRRLQRYYNPPDLYFKFSNDPEINASIVETLSKIMKERGIITQEMHDVFSNKELWLGSEVYDDFFDVDYKYVGNIHDGDKFLRILQMHKDLLGSSEEDESESKMVVSSNEEEAESEEKGEEAIEEKGEEEIEEKSEEVEDIKEQEAGEEIEEKEEGEEEYTEHQPQESKNDLIDVDDFETEWDYIVYLKQQSKKTDLEEQERKLPLLSNFYDPKAKKFDWNKLLEIDMQIERAPTTGQLTVYANEVDMSDNFGPIDVDDPSQIEIEEESSKERSGESLSKNENLNKLWQSRPKTIESLKEERDYSLKKIHHRYNDDALLFYIRHRLHMNEPRIKYKYDTMLEIWRHAKNVSTSIHVSEDDLRSSDFIRETEMFDRSVIDGTYPLMKVLRWRPKLPVIPGFSALWKPVENLLFHKLYIPVPGLWPVEMPRTYKRDFPFMENQLIDFPNRPDLENPFIKYPLHDPILLTTDEIKQLPKYKDLVSKHDVANVELLFRIQSFPYQHLYYNLNRAVENYLYFRNNKEFSSLPKEKKEQVLEKAAKIIQILSSSSHLEFKFEESKLFPQSFSEILDNFKKRVKNAFLGTTNKPPRSIESLIREIKRAFDQFFEDQKKIDDLCEFIYSYESDLYKKYVPEDFEGKLDLPDLDSLIASNKDKSFPPDENKEEKTEPVEENKVEPSEPIEERKESKTAENETIKSEEEKKDVDNKEENREEQEKKIQYVTQEEVENLIIGKILESNPFIKDYLNNNTEELRKMVQTRLDLSNKVRKVVADEKQEFEKRYFARRRYREARRPFKPDYPVIDFDVNEFKTEAEIEREKEEEKLKKKDKKKGKEEEEEKDENESNK